MNFVFILIITVLKNALEFQFSYLRSVIIRVFKFDFLVRVFVGIRRRLADLVYYCARKMVASEISSENHVDWA